MDILDSKSYPIFLGLRPSSSGQNRLPTDPILNWKLLNPGSLGYPQIIDVLNYLNSLRNQKNLKVCNVTVLRTRSLQVSADMPIISHRRSLPGAHQRGMSHWNAVLLSGPDSGQARGPLSLSVSDRV